MTDTGLFGPGRAVGIPAAACAHVRLASTGRVHGTLYYTTTTDNGGAAFPDI